MLLGVNIDHVATLRAVRGVSYPDLARAVREAEAGGADFITAHLREDRRHIRDRDVETIMGACSSWLNLEVSIAAEMIAIAAAAAPKSVCLVPERRQELTTEGGLDVRANSEAISEAAGQLSGRGIEVSLFIEPDCAQVEAAAGCGAAAVELHTGAYANLADEQEAGPRQLARLAAAASRARQLGLKVNAGHGLTVANVAPVAAIEGLAELNIGHSIVADAVFSGLRQAVADMRAAAGI